MFRFSFVCILSLNALLVFSVARASDPVANILRTFACYEAMGPDNHEEAKILRNSIKKRILADYVFIRGQRERETETFLESLSLPLYSSGQPMSPRPSLGPQTRRVLHLAYAPDDNRSGRAANEQSEMREKFADRALEIVNTDPYFKWLKGNSAGHRNAVELLFSNLKLSGLQFLPPDLSIIRVYRDLDPGLFPDQLNVARRLLQTYALESVIRNEIAESFDSNDPKLISSTAWSMATSRKEARRNYRMLLDSIRGYSKRVSQEAFEELRWEARIQKSTVDATEATNHFESAVADADAAKFRRRLNIDPEIEAARFAELKKIAGGRNVSYEIFLLRAFGGEAAPEIERVLSNLRLISELAEATDTIRRGPDAFLSYVRERVEDASLQY